MASWPWVVLPALLCALVVRLDAKLIGPYFSIGSILGATEGVFAWQWYEDNKLRNAFFRRMLYPVLLGFCLGWTSLTQLDLASVGALTALLLLWPLVFHGIEWPVPRGLRGHRRCLDPIPVSASPWPAPSGDRADRNSRTTAMGPRRRVVCDVGAVETQCDVWTVSDARCTVPGARRSLVRR